MGVLFQFRSVGAIMALAGAALALSCSSSPPRMDPISAAAFCDASDELITPSLARADLLALGRAIEDTHPDPDWSGKRSRPFHADASRLLDTVAGDVFCRASVAYHASLLLALASDGHTRLHNNELTETFGDAAIRVDWVGDALLVRAVRPADRALIGGRVLSINDMSIDVVTSRLRPMVPHNEEVEFLRFSERYFQRPRLMNALTGRPLASAMVVRVLVDGAAVSVAFEEDRDIAQLVGINGLRRPPVLESRPFDTIWWRTEGGIFMLRVNQLVESEGASFAQSVNDAFTAFDQSGAARILIDLRGNGGGNSALGVPIVAQVRARSALRVPGAVLVATDKYTYSAAVQTRTDLVARGGALTVGEDPAGLPAHPGDNVDFRLPNTEVLTEISSVLHRQAFWPAGRQPVIDVPAVQSISDYLEGRDSVLVALPSARLSRDSAPAPVLADSMGTYRVSRAHTLRLEPRGSVAWATIAPLVDAPLYRTDADDTYVLPTGLRLRFSGGGVEMENGADNWVRLQPTQQPSPWDALTPGNGEAAGAALAAAADDPSAPGLDDASLTLSATRVYFDAVASGLAPADAASMARAVLQAAQAINDPSPFADFAMRFYQ